MTYRVAYLIDAVLEQVGHAIGQSACLTRAGAGDDEQRPWRRGDSRELLLVQLRRVIDVDPRVSMRALKVILAGHAVYL